MRVRANVCWRDALESWKAQETARIAQLTQQAEQVRREADEHERRITTAIKNASEMATELPAANAYETLSTKLRELHLQGFQLGKFLTAQFIGSIDGFVRIRWSVQLDRPQPPRIDLLRDDEVISTTWGFAGEHGDLLKPGKRYIYSFNVYDNAGTSLAEHLVREVRVPNASVLQVDVAALARALASDTERDARMRALFARHINSLKLVHELTQAANTEVDSWDVDNDIKEWAKGQIEGFAAQLRSGAHDAMRV
jgi:hypothetical protein